MKEYLENRLVVLEKDLQQAYHLANTAYSHFEQVTCSVDIDKINARIDEVETILKHYLEDSI